MARTYKEAGVDIDSGNEFIKKIIPYVKSTYRPEVMAGVGGFAAHFSLNLNGIHNPVLVSSTDGVGTKLKIAQTLNKYDTLGYDLVAMCVNDICCSGAVPLFFLDYFAAEKLHLEEHSELVKGIAAACKSINCSLVGGETAELPGIYPKGEFDLAGFAVGIVDESEIIDGSSVAIGNTIIGLASSGIHSNGYSLVRSIIEDEKIDLSSQLGDSDKSVGEAILEPTKIYSNTIQKLRRNFSILSIAHITGGGLIENVIRTLPENCTASIELKAWERPEIFKFLQTKGGVDEKEMQRVFNLGIGMTITVSSDQAGDICEALRGLKETPYIIGEIKPRKKGEPRITLE